MRHSAYLIITILFAMWLGLGNARADIILKVDVADIDPTAPYGELSVYASSDADDSLIALTIDFELTGGRFATTPGLFGADGMLGSGNLHSASAFFRNDDRSASLSLDFNTTQAIEGNDRLLATLWINAAGLADGFYPVTIIDSLADGGRIDVRLADFGQPGGFNVRVVPEPTSSAGILLALYAFNRRRRQR